MVVRRVWHPFFWLGGIIREAVKAGYLLSGKSRDKVVIIFVVHDVDNERTYKVRAEPLKV